MLRHSHMENSISPASPIQNSHSRTAFPLKEQVAYDLDNYLAEFPNKNFGIRVLARETGLNEKTLKRLLQKKNNPTYQTLYNLYHVLLDIDEEELLFNNCPHSVKEVLKKKNPKEFRKNVKQHYDFEKIIQEQPLIAELFVLAGTGPLHSSAVAYRFGEYGLELLNKMEEYDIIRLKSPGVYDLSKNIPNLDGRILKFLGLRFTKRFSKPENSHLEGENLISFYAESLSEEGLKEWLKIDSEAFYKKIQIAKNPKYQGHQPAFTFNTTDTISWELK